MLESMSLPERLRSMAAQVARNDLSGATTRRLIELDMLEAANLLDTRPASTPPRGAEVLRLRQGYWDARAIMGFDNDGDPTPAALVSDMVEMMLSDARSMRADYDEAIAEQSASVVGLSDPCVRHACKRVRMEMQARIDALAEGIVWPSGVLNKADTLAILTQHNAWRRGAKTEQTDPCMVGLALDAAIAAIKGDSHAG